MNAPFKFPQVGCSQCGKYFGAGNEGFSSCSQHSQYKTESLARLAGALADNEAGPGLPNYLQQQATIFADLAKHFASSPMFPEVVSKRDEIAAEVEALKGDRFDVEELEIKGFVLHRDFVQVSGSTVAVQYDLEAGQKGYYSGPPEDCYPDIDDAIDITSVVTCEEFVFENADDIQIVIPACTEILYLFSDKDTERLEGQIIDKLEDEAEQSKRDSYDY